MNLEDVPADLLDLAKQGWDRHASTAPPGTYDHESIRRAILAAVLPAHERQLREAERAAIISGIKHYFAASEDPLYEDVKILCGRIERGEYGTRKGAR